MTGDRPRRGDIWLVDFGTPIGHEQGYRRPAVVVSSDRMNGSQANLLIVVPVTRTPTGLPSHVELDDPVSGLREISYAKCEDVKSISAERLVHRMGVTPGTALHRVTEVIVMLIEG